MIIIIMIIIVIIAFVTEGGKNYKHFKPALLAFTAMRFDASLSVAVKQRMCG